MDKAKREKSFKAFEENYKGIERIIKKYSCMFKPFSFYNKEDLEAEMLYICAESMHRFNPERSGLDTFLLQCMRTRLMNFKRNNFFRLENPCTEKKCKYYNVFTNSCISEYKKRHCKYMNKSENRMQSKKLIGEPHHFSSGEAMSEREKTDKVDRIKNIEEMIDVRDLVFKNYGVDLLIAFDIMMNFGKEEIKDSNVKKISEVVFDYYSD